MLQSGQSDPGSVGADGDGAAVALHQRSRHRGSSYSAGRPPRIGHATIDDIEAITAARRRMDDAVGGGSLLPAAREDLRVSISLLTRASYSAEAAAEEFSRTALVGGRGALTPAVEGSIHARLGEARARLGDVSGAAAAFDTAEELLTSADPAAGPAWIYWFTTGDLHGIAGESFLFAQQPKTAVTHLQQAVNGTDDEFSRDKTLWLSRKATAQVLSGEVDQGQHSAENALEILGGPLESRRVEDVFAEFCEALRTQGYRRSAPAPPLW